MPWMTLSIAYTAAYILAVSIAGADTAARVWVGNVGLMIPPFFPIAVVIWRHRDWSDRTLVFWGALAAGCALWAIGHIAWTEAELFDRRLLPWVEWPVAAKLCGGTLPMVALLAWPHASIRGASAASIAIDIAGIAVVSLFLSWSLILAPGLVPTAAPVAVHSLAIMGSLLHAVIVGSFVWAARSAGSAPWRAVYRDCALGAGVGALLLAPNVWTMLTGSYVTGSIGDIGWIVPFCFYAKAAAEAPRSEPQTRSTIELWAAASESGVVLLSAIAVAPLIGYLPRYLLPLGQRVDHFRDLATSATLALCCGLAVARVVVEQRGRRRADYRGWLLATACEHTTELIVVIRSNAIEYANRSFRKTFGFSLAELRLLSPISLVEERSYAMIADMVDTLGRDEIAHGTMNLRRRDASTFPATITVTPMASASGKAAYFVAVVRDLTEELHLRDRLVQSERMSAIGELVSSVAHEINNPLQAVLGSTDLLLKRPLDLDTRSEIVHLRKGAERAGYVVRNLLTFVRRDPGNRQLIDLNAIVREAAADCAGVLARGKIALGQHYGGQMPLVYVNREEVAQVVSALMRNAEEAMTTAHGGGTLIVRTYSSVSGAEAVLDVIDDGPGVPPAVAHRIFEPFFTTKTTGTGLGLSVTYGILDDHHATVEVESKPGEGTRFIVTFPVADQPI